MIQAELERTVAEALTTLLQHGAVPDPIAHVLKYFAFAHLPPHLRATSCSFAELACRVAAQSTNDETVVALRKLLEAKDAAVRAVIP